jgi:hypothetical protein
MGSFVWGAVFVTIGAALALSGLLWTRGRLTEAYLDTHHEVAGFLFGAVGVVYAVLLAFVVIVVWERYYDASQNAAQESNQLGDLWSLAGGFDEETGAILRGELVKYGRTVLDDEWPAMAARRESPEAWRAFQQIWDAYVRLEPRTDAERAVYDESLEALRSLGDSRRTRLHDSESRIPGVLWTALYGGAAITVAFTYLFQLTSLRLQLLMTALMVALMALVLFVVFAMSEPFAGAQRFRFTRGPALAGRARPPERRTLRKGERML